MNLTHLCFHHEVLKRCVDVTGYAANDQCIKHNGAFRLTSWHLFLVFQMCVCVFLCLAPHIHTHTHTYRCEIRANAARQSDRTQGVGPLHLLSISFGGGVRERCRAREAGREVSGLFDESVCMCVCVRVCGVDGDGGGG